VAPKNYGGLGLGLFVAHTIVKAHGGRLTVESAPGHGATFIVELPRAAPAVGPAAMGRESGAGLA
jgi:signal transduction histidine kinase